MTTRFTYPRPEGSLSTGYDNQKTSELTIPSCGLEDVDVALFELFDKELRFYVEGIDPESGQIQRKVPVVFAAGEKWALLKNNKPIRDKIGSLILPLITIMRTDVIQEVNDIVGRGINQQTGDLVIKRKLDKSDRAYQNIINKFLLKNQKNIAVNPTELHLTDQLLTDRETATLKNSQEAMDGALMAPNNLNNVYETLTIPTPQFYTSKYEITFWTQYTQQMNSMMEIFLSSLLPQGRCFKLQTKKGYWFVANVEESYSPETNFDDMSLQERLIKFKININVPAYVLASSIPGTPVAIRRHVSAPSIDFGITFEQAVIDPNPTLTDPSPTESSEPIPYPFLGADDPTLPMQTKGVPIRKDMRDTGSGITEMSRNNDPALEGHARGRANESYLKIGTKYYKGKVISTLNGETAYKGTLK